MKLWILTLAQRQPGGVVGALSQSHHSLLLSLHCLLAAFVVFRLWQQGKEARRPEPLKRAAGLGLLYLGVALALSQGLWWGLAPSSLRASVFALALGFPLSTALAALATWLAWRRGGR